MKLRPVALAITALFAATMAHADDGLRLVVPSNAPAFSVGAGAAQIGNLTLLPPLTAPSLLGAWDNHWLLIGPTAATGAGGGALALTMDRVNGVGYIAALSPGVAWLAMSQQASQFNFLSNGTYYGVTQDNSGNVILQGGQALTTGVATAPTTIARAESHAISGVTTSFTFTNLNHNVYAGTRTTALTAAVVATLPTCVTAIKGTTYGLKKMDTSANAATLTAQTTNAQTGTADLIDGAATVALTTQYAQVNVQCDGAGNWLRGFY